jgi:hypothetical protein
MVATVTSIAEVSGAVTVPGTTTAKITWVSQGLPKLKWAIFNGAKNISGPLKVTNYTLKGLHANTLYTFLLCSSIDGKKWTKGRPIYFRTTQNRSSIPTNHKPKKGAHYSLPSEVTNVSSLLGATSVTLSWTKGPSTTSVKITDGLGYLSPAITASTYTIEYGVLNDVCLYIMSSSDDVNYSLGTKVRSVVPDVDSSTMSATITPTDSQGSIKIQVTCTLPLVNPKLRYGGSFWPQAPISDNLQYEISPAPGINNADGTVTFINDRPAKQYQYTIFCTNYARSTITNTTYGTTIYVASGDPYGPQQPSSAVAVPRSDWSGWDISFYGSRGAYSAYTQYECCGEHSTLDLVSKTTPTQATIFVPFDMTPGAYLYGYDPNKPIYLYGYDPDGNQIGTEKLLVGLPHPQITNPVVTLGPSSVTISWTPEVEVIPFNHMRTNVICNFFYYTTPLTSVTLNYSDLTPNCMVILRNWFTHAETPVFFYTGPPVSGYTMSSNNTWMILVLLVILLLLLKKK